MLKLRTVLLAMGTASLVACGGDKPAETTDNFKPDPTPVASVPPPFTGQEDEVKAGDLAGTLIRAEAADSPMVIIVPGSGPTDRNGNGPNKMGLNTDTYQYLARGLYDYGTSTVRVDKSGMFGSAAAGASTPSIANYAKDYRVWAAEFAPQASGQCVYLLGHSEGALMVSAAAIEQDNICGLILVAGPGRKLGAILREQLKANPMNAPILDEAEAALDQLEQGKSVDTTKMHPALRALYSPENQPFLINLFAADPAAIAGSADKPTLILQGDRDIQIGVEDAELLQAATGGKLVILKNTNHVLKLAPDDYFGNAATYTQPDLPVVAEAIDAIAEFVTR